MFNTILKEVTVYFDRRSLITAFFPNLIFWGLTVIILLCPSLEWGAFISKLEELNGLSLISQAVLFTAFLVWVSFCSFLTLNFHTSIVRLYEGYWPETWLFLRLHELRRKHWYKEWIALRNRVESLLKSDNSNRHLCEEQKAKVVEESLRLDYYLLNYYPSKPEDIMPTQLGNVLKSAEKYSNDRYHLDSVLIWPRLEPALPKEFADSFRDAETSLVLMITLSAFTLLFGLPLSVWIALKSAILLSWWVPILIIFIAVPFRFYVPAAFALFSIILIFAAPTFIVNAPIISGKVQIFFILLASILLLAQLNYINAVQAGLLHGDKIRASFDLYRWKVLENLHLQLPQNLEEERKLWDNICDLIYRNYDPNFNFYQYELPETAKKSVDTSRLPALLPTFRKALPGKSLITVEDIEEIYIPEAKIPADAVRNKEQLVGQYLLEPVHPREPIIRSLLIDEEHLSRTVAIGIQATQAMILGGKLRPGDISDIILIRDTTNSEHHQAPIIFENILIQDIRSPVSINTNESNQSELQFTVIIALPISRREEFATNSVGAAFFLTKKF